MADATDRRVALLSIHPRFADAIVRGEKLVEFRRRAPSTDTSHVIVYATAPVQRIVGWFRIEAVEAERPAVLWERFGTVGGMGREEFVRYYGACEHGAAIKVAEVASVDPPALLCSVGPDLIPPQSFRYVGWAAFEALRQGSHVAPSSEVSPRPGLRYRSAH